MKNTRELFHQKLQEFEAFVTTYWNCNRPETISEMIWMVKASPAMMCSRLTSNEKGK
jgi:hypothetical protein